MEQLSELLTFLGPDARLDVKRAAIQHLLSLTGTEDGRLLVSRQGDTVYKLLLGLANDGDEVTSRDALLALLNLSAFETSAEAMLKLDCAPKLLQKILDPCYRQADKSCMILSNLTRLTPGAKLLTDILMADGEPTLQHLVELFNQASYNQNSQLHYLATVFSNISQLPAARQLFLDQTKLIILRLLPFVQYKASVTRRGGIVGLLRNLCFEVGRSLTSHPSPQFLLLSPLDSHKWLLSDQVDILPVLLLPLAGPEEFSPEEMEKLPLDLQYLPDDKQREQDPDVRRMLVEAITKVCEKEEGGGRGLKISTSVSNNYVNNRTCYDKIVCTILFSSRW